MYVFNELKSVYSESYLILIGDGPLKEKIIEFIEKNNLKERVYLKGRPTVITSAFSIDELEEAKPKIGSRLMDVTVNWQPITAPNYRDQRRTRRPPRGGNAPAE